MNGLVAANPLISMKIKMTHLGKLNKIKKMEKKKTPVFSSPF